MDDNKIESLLLSNELDEMIGRPPGWIIRWGITLLAIILAMIFSLSYIIKYPEIVTVPCRISSLNPAIEINVNYNGQIKKLNITDGAFVHKNDILFYWKDNSGNYLMAIAPVTGFCEFISALTNGTRISKDHPLFYIEPENSGFSADFYIDSDISHKLIPGQNITINVNDFPTSDYGSLKGQISLISSLKTVKGYLAKAIITDSRTDKNKIIPLYKMNNGNALIVIGKKRLFTKLTEKIP